MRGAAECTPTQFSINVAKGNARCVLIIRKLERKFDPNTDGRKRRWIRSSQRDWPENGKRWKNCLNSKGRRSEEGPTDMYTRPREDQGEISSLVACDGPMACCECVLFSARDDPKEYALKQIEGTGISMSACREIAVSYLEMVHTYVYIRCRCV